MKPGPLGTGLAALCVLCAAEIRFTAMPAAQSANPRLAVLIMVDQMRADYVDRFQEQLDRRLKRLVTRGAGSGMRPTPT